MLNVCGDGSDGPQEGCDDGNLMNDDGCSAACALEGCGDGIKQANEVGGPVTKVALGNRHTCALLANGAVRCCGVGSAIGQPTQIGPLGDNETPASKGDVNVGGPVADIDAGYQHTCVVMAGGGAEVKCWGDGFPGKLGYGNNNVIGDNEAPAAVGFVAAGGRPGQPRRQRRTHRRRPVPHLRDPDERLRALLGVQHPWTAWYGQLEQRRRQ